MTAETGKPRRLGRNAVLRGEWLSLLRIRLLPSIVIRGGSLAVGGTGVALYGFYLTQGGGGSDSTLGVGFGIAATVALAVVMVYSVRRAMPAVRRLGPARHYLSLHLYSGSLFLLFFLFHTNFGLPSGWLTTTLWLVTLWVVGTGALGTAFQRWLPKVLDDFSTFEVPFERIPELLEELRVRADIVAKRADVPIRSFYDREMSREMTGIRSIFSVRPGRTVSQTFRSHEMEVLRGTLDSEGELAMDELEAIHGAKLDLDRHYTLQSLLRGWLYFHLPIAIVLLGLVILHVFFVLYF